MKKYLTYAEIYAPLLPPLGDLPDKYAKDSSVEKYIWGLGKSKEEIRIIFPKPLKKGEVISDIDSINYFEYRAEIAVSANTIESAASRSIYLLEQVLDTCSLYTQIPCEIERLKTIVNLSQIEGVIDGKSTSFEKGEFKNYKLKDAGWFPVKYVFLSDQGAKKIGRNIFWFRRGLLEFSSLNRFASFCTALRELGEYFKELPEYKNSKSPLVEFLENNLNFPEGTFKKWNDLRGKILHYGNKPEDFQILNQLAKENLEEVYRATYFGIMRFFTDNPPQPKSLLFYDDLTKGVDYPSPKVIQELTAIYQRRKKDYAEVLL